MKGILKVIALLLGILTIIVTIQQLIKPKTLLFCKAA